MRIRQALKTAALIWLSALATPVAAQTYDQQIAAWPFEHQIAVCSDANEQISSIVKIIACTALLQSGRFNTHQLSWAYSNRGSAYLSQSDRAHALADYSEAIRLNPQFAPAYNNRGFVYDAQGDHTHAIADYSEAIRLNPQFALAYNNRAAAYDRLGNAARAAADRAEAARLAGR